ncbi:MAG: periplasmic heavy metal sensor [Candidatus Marinimicrobia bacterium]|jgi:Spy/CpxP family protein refolding chaperone|nr:periplasmic heavy metal sensor [Candidatus Neomarinimicrobiota bacterium]MBT3632591.1 periplasmic heavy metal sensor [Candidatus Neomarinimicrobiota bacterium]MBT3824990.1 periplasmic heavy metal sensor [Candidatus Neomarinimicrobiota bacterium]MBT4129150.1 periplasmic heavy metal sensor [Candidatus Neomarinimicrobiota bacterium]MBT4295219.1 periplasmic heavy metal sensor [Candidatus Neomarinimicrobiota bacterium]
MNYKRILLFMLTVAMLIGQGRRGDRMMTWDESLNLTTEQMQQITTLRESMQPAMQEIRQTTRSLEQELRLLNNSENPDAGRIAELEAAIEANGTAMDALMGAHRDQIRSLLTPDQQLIYDQHEFGPREGRRGPRGSRGDDNMGGRRGSRSGRPGR